MRRSLAAGVIAIGLAGWAGVMVAASASAATATATLYVDASGSSSTCTSAGTGACPTVQDAITAAEGAGYAGTAVTIDVASGTYTENDTITGGSEQSLTIQATPGSSGTVTLNGDAAGSVLTIDLSSAIDVNLDSLTITNGQSQIGGGIDDTGDGTLTVDDSTLTGNEAVGADGPGGVIGVNGGDAGDGFTAYGGGLAFTGSGTVDVQDTTISDNSALGGTGGAGADGDSAGVGGGSGGGGAEAFGGGLANIGLGTMDVRASTLSDNSATGGHGGSGGSGFNGTFAVANGANGGQGGNGNDGEGGGLINASPAGMTIQGSDITVNQAVGGDGGTAGVGGDGADGNAADPGGTGPSGGNGGNGARGGNGGTGYGGGVLSTGGTVVLQQVTISGNAATGGNGANGSYGGDGGNGGAGGNGGVSAGGNGGSGGNGNYGGDGGNGGNGYGGGIETNGAAIQLLSAATESNDASGGTGGSGGTAGNGGNGGVGGEGVTGGSGGIGGNAGNGGSGASGGSGYGGGLDNTLSGSDQLQDSTVSVNVAAGGQGGTGRDGGDGGDGGEGGAGTAGTGGNGGGAAGGGNGGSGGSGGSGTGGNLSNEGSGTLSAQNLTDVDAGANGGTGGDGGSGGAGANGGAPGIGTPASAVPGSAGDGGNGTVGGNGGNAMGGGNANASASTMTLVDATITGDSADFGVNGNGGQEGFGTGGDGAPGTNGSLGGASGGGLYQSGGSLSVGASIVADNEGGANCNSAVNNLGYNLTDDGQGASPCGFSSSTNDVMGQTDPVVGTLAEHGGPTFTKLPTSANSIAVPTGTTLGNVQACPRTDQRGVPGPIPGQSECTIGATEDLAGQAPALSSGSATPTYTLGASSQPGWPDTLTVTAIPAAPLTESGSLPSGVQFASGTGTGPFDVTGTFSGTPTATGVFNLTLAASNYMSPDLSTAVRLTVDQQTSTSLALTQGTAQVGQSVTYRATVTSEVPLNGGTVAFSDSLGAISGCGSQPLTTQSSTSATAICSTQSLQQSGADQVKASFSGDTEDLASSGSQTVQVAAAPATTTTTTTPTPTRTPRPSIRATVSSGRKKSSSGWWLAPVTVRFKCSAGGGKLKGGCPAAVRLTKSGRNESVRRTIRTTTGQHATVRVSGIDIDLTRPRVRITGPLAGGTFALTAPKASCHASDRVSGIKSCVLTEHAVSAAGGYKVTYVARAVSRSGASASARVVSSITVITLANASLVTPNTWSVTPGKSYLLQVLSRTKPAYLDAAPSPLSPTGPYDYFVRAGTVNGVPLWESPVTITKDFARFPSWVIGVRTGTTTVRIKLLT